MLVEFLVKLGISVFFFIVGVIMELITLAIILSPLCCIGIVVMVFSFWVYRQVTRSEKDEEEESST